jgi:hypothetical protein
MRKPRHGPPPEWPRCRRTGCRPTTAAPELGRPKQNSPITLHCELVSPDPGSRAPGGSLVAPDGLASRAEWLSSTSGTVPSWLRQHRPKSHLMSDRVSERRRAAQLARHYRDQENLTIAEIARRLGRAEATIKAYLYDPSDDNKRRGDNPQGDSSGRLVVMHGRRSEKPLLGSLRRRHETGVPDCPICPDGSHATRPSGYRTTVPSRSEQSRCAPSVGRSFGQRPNLGVWTGWTLDRS